MERNGIDLRLVRPLKRVEYDRLVESGAFDEERIELLHGLLVAKEPQGPDHSGATRRLHRLLLLALDSRAEIQSHSPFAAGEDSEPEPDVAAFPRSYTAKDHPSSAFLLVEIGSSSLRTDRSVKADLYAAAGVPEYWVASLTNRTVEVRSKPVDGHYQHMETFGLGDTITLIAFPDVTIRVDEFLGA